MVWVTQKLQRDRNPELLPYTISRRSIFTKATDKPTMKDYILEWKRLGFGDIVDRFRQQHSLEKFQSLVENSYISKKRQKALLRLMFKRSEELCEI